MNPTRSYHYERTIKGPTMEQAKSTIARKVVLACSAYRRGDEERSTEYLDDAQVLASQMNLHHFYDEAVDGCNWQ
jgi:hypothetical protein